MMKRHRNKTFKFSQDIDRAYQLLFRPVTPAGCVNCGDDDLDTLGIHKIEGRPGLQVLCGDCHDKMVMDDCFKYEKYNTTQEGITL